MVKDRNRDIELTRMRLLNPSLMNNEQLLSSEEIQAITAHLQANIPSIRNLLHNDPNLIRNLVAKSVVVEVSRSTNQDSTNVLPADIIYQRGKVAHFCVLILSGKVEVLAGKDEFRVELGPWSALGADCLGMDQDMYVPDFSAHILSPQLKYLKLSTHGNNVVPMGNGRRKRTSMMNEANRQRTVTEGSEGKIDSDGGASNSIPSFYGFPVEAGYELNDAPRANSFDNVV